MNACACVGPQYGEPVCPCRMQTWDWSAGVGVLAIEAAKQRNAPCPDIRAWAARLAKDVGRATD